MKIEQCFDTQLLSSLHTDTFPGDELPNFEKSESFIVIKDFPIAFFTIEHNKLLNYVDITRVGVKTNFCGKGVNGLICKYIDKYCKARNITLVLTYIKKDNFSSLASFIKNGYYIYNPLHEYINENEFYHLMRRL
jgi:hypothetical protein